MSAGLWLTEIRLNERDRTVGRDLRSVTQLHRTVMSLFPDTAEPNARQSFGVLHRLDSTANGPVLLVQSQERPNADAVAATYGTARTVSLLPLFERLSPGLQVRYRILLNATKRVASGEQKGKRLALGAQATRDWWAARAAGTGLQLVGDCTLVSETLSGREGDDGRITVRPWRVDGTATVQDAASLAAAITAGIGKGRSYGCGLLTIAPTSPLAG